MRDVRFSGVRSTFFSRLAWLALCGPAVAMAQFSSSVTAPMGAVQAALNSGAAPGAGAAGVGATCLDLPGGAGQLSRTLGSGSAAGQVRAPGELQGPQVGAGAQAQNVLAESGAGAALATTQFQRFVQDATGRLLPLYGYNLFDRGRFPSTTAVSYTHLTLPTNREV